MSQKVTTGVRPTLRIADKNQIPATEPERQYYFMDIAEEYLRQLSEEKGNPLTFHVSTFGCQMNARDSEKLVGILEKIGFVEEDSEEADFVIYNIPQLAGTGLTMSLLHEMLKNPNVVAVKNSSMPTQDIQMFKDAGIAARGEGNFVVFNGPDEQFVSGRVIGADGGIGGTYAVMPELYLAMNEHINKGEIEAARAIQYDADRIIYKMCEAHGNLYAVQKEILRRMYGLELGGVREPMPGLIPEDEPIVAEAQAMIEAAIAKL